MLLYVFMLLAGLALGIGGGLGIASLMSRSAAMRLFRRAQMFGVNLSYAQVVEFERAKIDGEAVIGARIDAKNHGIAVDEQKILRFQASGCDIRRAVQAAVAAKGLGVSLTFDQACSMLLAGRDPMTVVEEASRPDLFVSERSVRHKVGDAGKVLQQINGIGVVRIGQQDVRAVSSVGVLAPGTPITVQGYAGEVVFVSPATASRQAATSA